MYCPEASADALCMFDSEKNIITHKRNTGKTHFNNTKSSLVNPVVDLSDRDTDIQMMSTLTAL